MSLPLIKWLRRSAYVAFMHNRIAGWKWLVVGLFLQPVLTLQAQPTNLHILDSLATACLQRLPDTLQALQLEGDPDHPYLQPAIASFLQQQSIRVWLQQAPASLPRLAYRIPSHEIHYTPAKGKRLQRSIHLVITYQLLHADGHVLWQELCSRRYTDVIDRQALANIEDPAFPQTQGTRPPSIWQRYIQPALWIGATAITVYLLFTLRGQRR